MPRIIIVQVVYNSSRFIEPVFKAIESQTFKDFKTVAVISGNEDGSKELLAEKFPEVEIIDPGFNIGFSKGHNLVFERYDCDLFQLVNPDLVMRPDYLEKMASAFSDPAVGAASGKLLKCRFSPAGLEKTNIIDSTGVLISKSGRGRDRGQHEEDRGQYDGGREVTAVSAAGAMYSKKALQGVKYVRPDGNCEYFDEDFHSYWEDVDLAWRMTRAGFKCVYVPQAVAYHGRAAGSSQGGYKKILAYIKFHRSLPQRIRQLNYKNHIFMYLKNSRRLDIRFFAREFLMLAYVIFFEPGTLKVLPEFFRQLPLILKKRKAALKAQPFT